MNLRQVIVEGRAYKEVIMDKSLKFSVGGKEVGAPAIVSPPLSFRVNYDLNSDEDLREDYFGISSDAEFMDKRGKRVLAVVDSTVERVLEQNPLIKDRADSYLLYGLTVNDVRVLAEHRKDLQLRDFDISFTIQFGSLNKTEKK